MTPPTCPYCNRPFSDPRGCDYLDGDERPMTYGTEQYPLSAEDTCRDCAASKGSEHHVECLCTECRACHRQWHPGMTCAEDAELTTGGAAA